MKSRPIRSYEAVLQKCDGVRKTNEDIKSFLKDACLSMSSGAEKKEGVGCSVGGMLLAIPASMFAEGIDPRVPAAAFSSNYHKLLDPGLAVNKACNAGKVFSLLLQGYLNNINSGRKKFLALRKKLIDAGELNITNLPEE